MRYKGFLFVLLITVLCVNEVEAQKERHLTINDALQIASISSPRLRISYLNLQKYEQNVIAQKASMKSQFSFNFNPVNYSKDRRFDNRLSQWYTNESFSTSGVFKMEQPLSFSDGTISLINNFSWLNNQSDVGSMSNSNQSFKNNLYLELNQPLFTYNRRKMKSKGIKNDYENALISYALQKLNTEKNISTQFYSVYMAQQNLEISKNEFENAQKSYEIIRDKVESDLSAKEELFQAEINRSSAESELEQKRVSLQNILDVFKKTLGLSLDEKIVVDEVIDIKKVSIDLEKAIDNGLHTRLELRQREITTQDLKFQLVRTKALNEFKGSLSLSVGMTGNDENFDRLYHTPTTSPAVALTYSIPIFDWGENKARVKAQLKSMEVNEINAKEEIIDVELDIRKTYRNLMNLERQIDIAKKNVENSKHTYDLNLIKYREGDLSGMDINQFQNQLSNKRIQYSSTLINYHLELLNLKILSLFDFEKNKQVVPLVSEKKY